MSTQELPEELIILGNGFDLACGLKSSYKSFFESYLDKKVKKGVEELFTSFCDKKEFELSNEELAILNATSNSADFDSMLKLEEKHKAWKKKKSEFDIELSNLLKNDAFVSINFFDIYFILNSLNEITYPNWSDVELAIQKLLIDDNVDNDSFFVNMKNILYCLKTGKGKKESLFIITLLGKINKPLALKDIERRILEHLFDFEEKFKKYINSILQEGSYFKTYAEDKLFEIVNFNDIPINILTFNYTTFLRNVDDNYKALKIENVHGTLKSKIVFGVDDIAIDANNNLYSFTKTSRMMNNTSYDENSTPILHPNIKKIKFYGHSLSEMDYSYFQSIFDFYNLYGSDVQLFFYYSIYDKKIAEDIKSNHLQAITKMIHKYGATMDNKDHGRNLQHKLLLEKRIHIICI